ncbi:MAG: zinc ribbon domain-containing protein [Candidatus Natronoplasma sp.]
MKRCINCGEKAEDEDNFCTRCGEMLPEKERGKGTSEISFSSDHELEREQPVKIKAPTKNIAKEERWESEEKKEDLNWYQTNQISFSYRFVDLDTLCWLDRPDSSFCVFRPRYG